MSEDAVAAHVAARPHRRISAFHSWRRTRPFWGGLLLLLSGGEIFLSSNEDLGSLHVQIGVTGFLSYIVPLFIVLCGALIWATPAQRVLYGVLAVAASIYSVISVNLGGFLVGMLLGIFGGSLSVAWVPDKFAPADIPSQRTGEPDDGSMSSEPDATTDDFFARGEDTDEAPPAGDAEGKQGARFPEFPGSRGGVDGGTNSSLPYRSPRALGLALVAALIGTAGFIAVSAASPAIAADCVPPTLTQLVKSATASPSTPKNGTNDSAKDTTNSTTTGKSSVGKKSAVTRQSNAEAPVVPHAESTTGPLSTLLNGVGSLLGADPSDSPSETPSTPATPTDDPSTPAPPAEPTPSATPTVTPSPSVSPSAAPTATPTKSSGPSGGSGSSGSGSTAPAPDPSSSAPCAVVANSLGAEAGLPLAGPNPSTQTAAKLTMHGLRYDGNYELKTKSGTIEVMQFSMDSSTSTPFELDTTQGGKTIRTKSSELTVSGNVKFYATEIKGNVLGVLPQDYTPDNPPPVVPSELFFTDVTIGLALVTCDTLTAANLTITSPA